MSSEGAPSERAGSFAPRLRVSSIAHSNWTRNKVVARSSGFYCLIDITRLKRDMHSRDKWQRRAGDANGASIQQRFIDS